MKKYLILFILSCCTQNLPTKIEYKKLSQDYLGQGHMIALVDEKYLSTSLIQFKKEFQTLIDKIYYPSSSRFIYPFSQESEKAFWNMWETFFKEFPIEKYSKVPDTKNNENRIDKREMILVYNNKIMIDPNKQKEFLFACPLTLENQQENPLYLIHNKNNTVGIVKKNLVSQPVYNSSIWEHFHIGYEVYSAESHLVMSWIFGDDKPFLSSPPPTNRYTSLEMLYNNTSPGRVYAYTVDGAESYTHKLNCYNAQYYFVIHHFPL